MLTIYYLIARPGVLVVSFFQWRSIIVGSLLEINRYLMNYSLMWKSCIVVLNKLVNSDSVFLSFSASRSTLVLKAALRFSLPAEIMRKINILLSYALNSATDSPCATDSSCLARMEKSVRNIVRTFVLNIKNMEQSTPTKDIYLQKINKVVEYINNHLDSPLDVKTLAKISGFSMFHFHRIMKAFLREPLYEYISRIRLETAARLLRYSQLPIQEIGDNIGYDAPSSLSRAFKQQFGISPNEYRNNKEYIIQREPVFDEKLELKSPKIKELKDRKIIYIHLLGAYSDCGYGAAYTKLWNHIRTNKLFSAGMDVFSICYDDPKVTEDDKCRTDACVVIRKETDPDGDIGVKELKGGLFAVFLHKGPYEQLSAVYDTIFAQWLPSSGYQTCDLPIVTKYLNNPSQTAPAKLKTEIYIPIK